MKPVHNLQRAGNDLQLESLGLFVTRMYFRQAYSEIVGCADFESDFFKVAKELGETGSLLVSPFGQQSPLCMDLQTMKKTKNP